MEQFNLGGSIGQLKVLKEQYFDETTIERKGVIMIEILQIIDNLDIPELLGSEFGEL
tara:strand:- start:655 stop:825 length:171 start_codon:yes stop_codon:yes gene_type:complete